VELTLRRVERKQAGALIHRVAHYGFGPADHVLPKAHFGRCAASLNSAVRRALPPGEQEEASIVTAGPAPDSELAARFAAAAAPLVDALKRSARRLTQCEADAEDLLQDTLLHAYQGFSSFQPDTNLNAWLFRILHNRWVSRHRYQQRRPAEVPLDVMTDGAWQWSAISCSAEAAVIDAMPDGDVVAALAQLSDKARTAMFYVGVRGYTYAETASLMGVPMGTVMSRVSRGRQQLRIALAHLDPRRDENQEFERCSA
jgi:RNA polymerase sigma factor (sigma-70 family)